MCTEESKDAIVVCDVAIQDVRDALVDLPGDQLHSSGGQGTRVLNTTLISPTCFVKAFVAQSIALIDC